VSVTVLCSNVVLIFYVNNRENVRSSGVTSACVVRKLQFGTVLIFWPTLKLKMPWKYYVFVVQLKRLEILEMKSHGSGLQSC